MNKKKSKIVIIIVGVIFIIVAIALVLINFINKDKKELYSVVDSYILNYKIADIITPKLIMVSDGKKMGFIDNNNERIIELKYDYNQDNGIFFNDKYILIKQDKKDILIDLHGNEILKDYDEFDIISNKIVAIKSNNMTIFNNDLKEIINTSNKYNYFIMDKVIVIYNDDDCLIYDIDGNFLFNGTYEYSNNYFLVLKKDSKYGIYYFNKKNTPDFIYEKYSTTDTKLLVKENKQYKLLDEKGNILKTYNNELNNFYILSNDYAYSDDGCNRDLEEGEFESYGKLYDIDGNLISNICAELSYNNNSVLAFTDTNSYYYKNKKLIKTYDNYHSGFIINNEYIELFKDEKEEYFSDVFDKDGNKVLNKISYFYNYNNNYYVELKNDFVYSLNNDLTYNNNELFLSIANYNSLLIYKALNGKYGIMDKDAKKLIEGKYTECEADENIAICKCNNRYELSIVKYLTKKEYSNYALHIVSDVSNASTLTLSYKEINVNDIIKQYKLDNIKDVINNNEELFKQYAYAVINNNSLEEFKPQTLQLFKVIIEMQNYLDFNTLVNNVSKLSITYYKNRPPEMVNYAVGQYYNSEQKILLIDKSDDVVYHELLHFLQFNKDREYDDLNSRLYKCQNNYLGIDDVLKLNDEEIKLCSRKYLTYISAIEEASAEENSSEYLGDGYTSTYFKEVQIYETLEYLLGTDTMNEISFSSKRNVKLFSILNKYLQFDIEKFDEFISNLDAINAIDINYKISFIDNKYHLYKVCDTLIDLYIRIKGNNWQEDILFSELIKNILFQKASDYISISSLKAYLSKNKLTIKYIDDYSNYYKDYQDNLYQSYKKNGYTIIDKMQIIIGTKNSNFSSNNAIVYYAYDEQSNYGYYTVYYDNSNNEINTTFNII